MSASHRRVRALLISVLGVALLAAAYSAGVVRGESAPKTAVRESLAVSSSVRGAPGRTLGLSRITIPAGLQLALHHHPGTQIAQVMQGTLTYTVKQGSVTVRTGDADTGSRVVRTITSGHTADIKTGQWVVEQPTTIHQGANRGTTKVVLLLSTLFPKGSPASIPKE